MHTQRVHHPYTAKLWARWVSKVERDKGNAATHELESRGQVGSAGLKGTEGLQRLTSWVSGIEKEGGNTVTHSPQSRGHMGWDRKG